MDINVILIDDNRYNLRHMTAALDSLEVVPFESETIHSTFHPMEPVLLPGQKLDLEATVECIRGLNPGVAIIDMRLEGDDPGDYSGVKLSQRVKADFDGCCIILVSSYFQSTSELVRYLDVFRYCVDRSKSAEDYQKQLQDSFTNAIKTHVSTKKYRSLLLSSERSRPKKTTGTPSRRTIYISYAWWGEKGDSWPNHENIVHRLYESLQNGGYDVRWDKTDIGFKKPISEFMGELARGACVVVVISDKYLRSAFCMSELLEIYRNRRFQDRIIPIVLGDASISTTPKRMAYIAHWNDELKELEDSVRQHDLLKLLGGQTLKDLERCRDIERNVDKLLGFLADMNYSTPEKIEAKDFTILKKAINSCLNDLEIDF